MTLSLGVVANMLIPAVSRSGSVMVAAVDLSSYRRTTLIDVIETWGEVDDTQVEVWVKNVGSSRIIAVQQSDVFFGPAVNVQGIPYGGTGCAAPCWSYVLENDVDWNPTATLHLTLQLSSPLVFRTNYTFKMVAPNGVEASDLLPMTSFERYYLHNNPSPPTGDTASQDPLPLNKTLPTATTLYNYDTDRDSDAGLLILKNGSGPTETDTRRYQAWRTPAFSVALTIDGTVNVILGSAIKNFGLGRPADITVYLRHYDGVGYTEIANGSLAETDWQGGSTTWVMKTFSIADVNYTIPAGDMLEVKLIVDSSFSNGMWFSYDTAIYSSRVELP
ncbi:MAG: hypothetical protein IIB87_07450 [Chloroflexi bacterium]|nr:hypothetical protein [Chloroflexota bacterium]